MFRTVTLSVLMLISVGIMLPFASSTAHGIRQSSAAPHHRRHRHHSRAWWRRHRARMRLRRAAARAHRTAPLAPVVANPGTKDMVTTMLPTAPAGWTNPTLGNDGEVRFRTASSASMPSQATLSVVARSRPNPDYLTQRERRRMLAGTAFSDLRRIVIDKMINAGGWVINDYERQFSDARVFVVIAQTPSDARSPEKSWNFYFAEVDGKIYSLTLNTPLQFSGQLEGEGQKFIASLRSRVNTNVQTATR